MLNVTIWNTLEGEVECLGYFLTPPCNSFILRQQFYFFEDEGRKDFHFNVPWILVCWTVFISDIILVVISSEVNEATDDFDTLYAQCMTKLFFGSSYFLLLLKHCIYFLFFWVGGESGSGI